MEIAQEAKVILEDIEASGGKVYLVGGCVRDMVMNISGSKDIDIEVYHMTAQQLKDVLSRHGVVKTMGQAFAIMQLTHLSGYDFALPRCEKKSGDRHQDFEVIVDPELSLDKAIERRDLTMNALMYDYRTKEIVDLCGGVDDIHNGIIRCVNPDTFKDDPLRVLRIAQFIARFDMNVEEKTKAYCHRMVKEGMLTHLSKERVYHEYCQMLQARYPSLGFQFLKEIDALPDYLAHLVTTQQRLDYHPEGDVFTHTMLVIDIAALVKHKTSDPLSFMWSCLLHDIGKPDVTTAEGHAPKHNESGIAVFQKVDLIQSRRQRQYIETMIFFHMHLMNMARNQTKDITYLRLLKQIQGKVPMNDLVYLSYCDKLGRGMTVQSNVKEFFAFIKERIERLGTEAQEPLIDGRILIAEGFQSDYQWKVVLEDAYDLQLQGMNRETILRSLNKKYGKR